MPIGLKMLETYMFSGTPGGKDPLRLFPETSKMPSGFLATSAKYNGMPPVNLLFAIIL
jgi:hypothetical protein